MSDLLSLLGLGGAGIAAQNTGIALAQNNVANANTDGYSRQRVDLQALEAAPLVGGVRAGDPTRLADSLLGARMRTNSGSLSMSTAYADALADAEQRLTGNGATIDEQLGTLYAKLSQVAATPTDDNLRDAAVNAAKNLTAGIRQRAADIAAARTDADTRLRDHAVEATALANQLARANRDVAASNDPTLRDKRDQLAQKLSQLVGGQARIDSDGQMRFVLDGGAVLVDGQRAATLQATVDPATGYNKLEVVDGNNRRDVTAQLSGGSMGADLTVRDRTLAKVANGLDQLAYDVANGFNAVHSANAGKDGVTGRAMFTTPTAVAGAARTIDVDPALAANSTLLATAAPNTGPGDNTGALALYGISTQPIASGGTRTPTDAALDIVSSLALETQGAKDDVGRETAVSQHLGTLRDSISGVDVQEELTNLAKFENVSSAMTKFVSTIDGLLGSLIQNL